MEVVWALLLLMFGTSAAAPQDLTGKWLTFPEETDLDPVIMNVNRTELGALSVCMRVFSDLGRTFGLFYLTTNSSRESLELRNHADLSVYKLQYNDTVVPFNYKDNYIINAWQAVCSTWDADTGLAQIWIDGKHSSRKFLTNESLKSPMTMILGQISYSSYFRGKKQRSFVGMITDLHVWDRVLLPKEIQNFALYRSYPHGNVLDWSRLDFSVHGRVLVE